MQPVLLFTTLLVAESWESNTTYSADYSSVNICNWSRKTDTSDGSWVAGWFSRAVSLWRILVPDGKVWGCQMAKLECGRWQSLRVAMHYVDSQHFSCIACRPGAAGYAAKVLTINVMHCHPQTLPSATLKLCHLAPSDFAIWHQYAPQTYGAWKPSCHSAAVRSICLSGSIANINWRIVCWVCRIRFSALGNKQSSKQQYRLHKKKKMILRPSSFVLCCELITQLQSRTWMYPWYPCSTLQ